MRIVIPGVPIAKARPKFICRGRHAVAYDPQDLAKKLAKSDLFLKVDEYFNVNTHEISSFKALFSDQKKVRLEFHVPIADSHSEAQKNEKLWGFALSSKKDLDNYIKFTLDIGNQILWHDDAQIVEIHAIQKYSENPCTIISVFTIKKSMSDSAKKVCKVFSPKDLELLQTHLCVLRDSLAQIERCTYDEKNDYIESAAQELITFANEYAQRLNKIKGKA